MTDQYALIGQPVAHSLSPRVHAAFAEQTGQTLEYTRIECPPESFEARVRQFFADGGCGLNVTLPHKAAALALCDDASADARLAGAANTLWQADGRLIGDNTDGAGLVADLIRLGASPEGRRVLLIGAGGAARGVLKPLLDQRPAELVWSNRNPLKLEPWVERYATLGPLRGCANFALKGDRFDLVVHATSAGHQGLVPQLPKQLFSAGGIAYDISYGAAARPFLDWAAADGAAACHDGMGMLVAQAAESFQRWRGIKPDWPPILEALRATL